MFENARKTAVAAVEMHCQTEVINVESRGWEEWEERCWDEEPLPTWSEWSVITGDGSEWLVRLTGRRISRQGWDCAKPYEDNEVRLSIRKEGVWPGFTSASGNRAWEIPAAEAPAECAT